MLTILSKSSTARDGLIWLALYIKTPLLGAEKVWEGDDQENFLRPFSHHLQFQRFPQLSINFVGLRNQLLEKKSRHRLSAFSY